jgi:hypothetical protein
MDTGRSRSTYMVEYVTSAPTVDVNFDKPYLIKRKQEKTEKRIDQNMKLNEMVRIKGIPIFIGIVAIQSEMKKAGLISCRCSK